MRLFSAVLAALLVAGCYVPIEYGPTAPPSLGPSPSPAPLLLTDIELARDEPVLEGSDLEPGDHYGAVLPAAYLVDDGVHHLYVVGFGDGPDDQRVFHVTSTDGVAWIVDEADPFANLGLDLVRPGPIPGTVLKMGDEWVMYLWGIPKVRRGLSQIYRAVASGPGGPWVADPDPVVPAGEPGEDDDRGLDFPSVISTGDGWLMLYGANGGDHPNAARVLAASSSDGIAWQKLGRVIEPQHCAGADSDYITMPRVFGSGYGYVVLTLLGNDIAALTSIDGRTWSCIGDGPMFEAPEIDGSDRVHSVAAAFDGERLSVIIEALLYDAQGGVYSNLWLANSEP